MRVFAAVLVASLACALTATAQTSPSSEVTAPATPQAPSTAPKPGSTVSGVTVEGRKAPTKSCSSRDKDCIAVVVAELKARFPKELQQWCDTVEYRAAATNMTIDDLNATTNSPGTTSQSGMFYPPAVAKVACAKDKKDDKSKDAMK